MKLSEYLQQKQQPRLPNLKEDFWNEDFILTMHCVYCEVLNDMLIQITKQSIKLVCNNPLCKKVYFYRRVSLGAIE